MTHCINKDGDIWQGEPINGVQHPQNIVNLWTDEELAEVGLTRVTPEPPPKEAMLRAERDSLLSSLVDPVASNLLRWGDLTLIEQQAWANYRRALLDVPQQEGFPQNVVWPVAPE